ncbi:MAG: CinA family nicotinamide mononucleotide deamidase-related protein [Rhodospirillales bacterium]|nr:CinA family nicotinamide mononucleotide deamidase-related protein [Rhodospirillales bacterium]
MRCEVVAIGTELLLGQIVDSNSSWIGEQLALAGIDSLYQTRVGDNFARMEATLRQALERSDAVICCGGLGPTQDDITRDVIAAIMGVRLVRDEGIVARIKAMFDERSREMTDNNRRQADIPEGAAVIAEMPGTAPGMVCPVGEKVIYAVPGVPHEMKEMMLGTILPDLQRRRGAAAVIRSRVLKTWGLSESGLAGMMDARFTELDTLGNPTLAFQASGIEGIKVRVTAKTDDEASAFVLLDQEEALVRGIVGDHLFAVDDDTMETVVLAEARRRGWRLAAHESLTGGVLASRMTLSDPEMAVFRGSIVAGAVTEEGPCEVRAVIAAGKARQRFGTDLGIAAVAPVEADEAVQGSVCLGMVHGSGEHATTVALSGDRNRLRNHAVISLLDFVRKTMKHDS